MDRTTSVIVVSSMAAGPTRIEVRDDDGHALEVHEFTYRADGRIVTHSVTVPPGKPPMGFAIESVALIVRIWKCDI